MTIKPEDVSQELLELAMERFENAYWNDVSPEHVALFLQDAIDFGLVSPPCYCVRWNGEIQTHDPGLMEDMVKLFPGKPWASDCEHWKGQTE